MNKSKIIFAPSKLLVALFILSLQLMVGCRQPPSNTTISSTITCPECKFSKTEILPTEVCQIKYTCTNCQYLMTPKDGDCCVFCSYGDHKCPSMQ